MNLINWIPRHPLYFKSVKVASLNMETSAPLSKKFEADCSYIHRCFSGGGASSDLRKVAEIFARRNMEELRLIHLTYRALYNQDLLHLLSQKGNPLARVAYLRAKEPHDRDAEMMRGALFGESLDPEILTEVICTRSSSELRSSKQAYHTRYHSHVEQDVSNKTSGTLKEVLVAVLNSSSYCGARVDTSMAMCDAKTLYEAVESGRYIDRKSIVSVLNQRSTSQMKAILTSYKQLYGHEFMKFLKKDKCGEFGRQLRVVVRCIQSPEKQFAKQLRRTLKNGDAREVLIRTVVTRSGIDIKSINDAFTAKTGWSLESLIRNEFNNSSGTNNDMVYYELVGDVLVAFLKHS